MSRARGIIKPYARYVHEGCGYKKMGVCAALRAAREMEMRPKN